VSREKFSERRMDARTSVVCMHLDDLRVGVKSLSSLAMAGSCRNISRYSLVQLVGEVKYGSSLQDQMVTKLIPTQNLLTVLNRNEGWCVRYYSETRKRVPGVKVPKYMLSVSKGVLNLRQ